MEMWKSVGVLVFGLTAACSGSSKSDSEPTGDTAGAPTAEDTICALRSEAGQTMTPGTAAASTAPAIMDFETPYTIQLTPTAGGWVRLVIPEEGNYTIHTGFVEVMTGLWIDTEAVPLGSPTPNSSCPSDIPEVFSLRVQEPQTYYMQLGPLSSLSFWILVHREEDTPDAP